MDNACYRFCIFDDVIFTVDLCIQIIISRWIAYCFGEKVIFLEKVLCACFWFNKYKSWIGSSNEVRKIASNDALNKKHSKHILSSNMLDAFSYRRHTHTQAHKLTQRNTYTNKHRHINPNWGFSCKTQRNNDVTNIRLTFPFISMYGHDIPLKYNN